MACSNPAKAKLLHPIFFPSLRLNRLPYESRVDLPKMGKPQSLMVDRMGMRTRKALPKSGAIKATKPRRATTTEAAGRVALVEGPANSRLFLNLGGKYLHRIERERRELYAGDHDLAIVVEVISAASTEPLMRDPAFLERHEYYLAAIPVDEQRGVSASAIAKTSGIARETVRRKIRRLLELGLIVEKERARYVLKPGILLEPHRQAAFARGIGETVRFINELLHRGLIRWVPVAKGKP